MTEKDINIYNNGKIYTIRCRTDNNLIYVGSTTQPLHKRWFTHKSRLVDKNFDHYILYKKMKEIGKDNFYIELYENYNCNSKEELNRREGGIIRQIGNLNKIIAGRTPQEYYKDHINEKREYEKKYMSIPENREKRNEYQKQYKRDNYEKNKDHVEQQRSQPFACECGCVVRKGDLTRHKKTEKHKYFEEHNEPKPLIGIEGSREKSKQKITCECGCIITKSEMSKHRKTQKHINLMKQKEEQI